MRVLQRRAVEIGGRVVRERLRTIERVMREHLPQANVEGESGSLRLSGRNLRKQWLSNPALRFLSGSYR